MTRGRGAMVARLGKILDLCTPIELARMEAQVVRGVLEQHTEGGALCLPDQELREISMRVAALPARDQTTYQDLVDEAHEARSLALAVGPTVGGAAVAHIVARQGGQGWRYTADLAALVSQLSAALWALLEAETGAADDDPGSGGFMSTLTSLAATLPDLEAQARDHAAHLDAVANAMTEGPVTTGQSCLNTLDEIRDKLGGTDTVPPAWRDQLEEGLSLLRQGRMR